MNRHERCIAPGNLKVGDCYYGLGRNFDYAIWDGKTFHGLRYKFGDHFMDTEEHYDLDPHHGTFQPLRHLE